MLDKAISKIKTEMERNSKSTYIKVVGNFLLQHLEAHPEAAESILTEGKTLKGSLTEMRKVAEKQKDGAVAILTDEEGYTVVLKYFGIKADLPPVPASIKPTPVPAPEIKHDVFDVKLEDLLNL